jgi:hypothetical protein
MVRYREIQAELALLYRKIPAELRVFLEDVPSLDKEEEPEPFRRPTRDECLKIFTANLESDKKDKPVNIEKAGIIFAE